VRLDDYKQLTFSRREHGVLLITLSRPEKYNAADEEMHGELVRVWTDVAADPGTRVAVITGAGRAFSAGGDLAMVERMAGDYDRVSHMLTTPRSSGRCWPAWPRPATTSSLVR
jgi:enoyl-CoA hydratase